jgi:hypothetical protein
MCTATTIFSWALAVAPPSPAESFAVDDIEVDTTAKSVQLTTYDSEGEVSGEIVTWIDGDGRVRLDANFADGEWMSTSTDGERDTTSSSDAAKVSERMSLIQDVLHEMDSTAGWGACALHAVDTAISCTAAVLWCPVAATIMACECLPEIIDEWEDYHCPGFG